MPNIWPRSRRTGEHVDARADLYALGCTMYAMLAGTAPFSGEALEVLQQHLTQPPPPLREQRADIPPPLWRIWWRNCWPSVQPTVPQTPPRSRPGCWPWSRIRRPPSPAMPAGALGAVPKSAVPASAMVDATDPTIEYGQASPRTGRWWRLAAAVVATALLAVLVSLMATSRSGPVEWPKLTQHRPPLLIPRSFRRQLRRHGRNRSRRHPRSSNPAGQSRQPVKPRRSTRSWP